jgi:alanine racemase
MLVNDTTATLVGRVSMDTICVDLRNQPEAQVGDGVTLWGVDMPVERIAQRAGTISYELLCAVTSRVPRFYQSN